MTSSLDKFLFEFAELPPEPPPPPRPPRSAPVEPTLNTEETRALVRVAVALFHWNGAAAGIEAALTAAGQQEAAARLRVAREEMTEALKEGGIEIDNPLGRTMAEVIDHVAVRGWRQQEGAVGETVSQVIAPIIRHRAAIIRRGQVIMSRAPLENKLPAEGISAKEPNSSSNSQTL